MTETGWVERVANLKVWRQRGERAPHKPLLLLYALSRLQRTGSSSMTYADAEGDLDTLLTEFGPPRKTSPSYPFHHLTSDGLWTVATRAGTGSPGDTRKALRESQAVGSLAPDFAGAVDKDPVLFASVVKAVLDANFPASLHESILMAIGLDVDLSEALHRATTTQTRRRDPAFREMVLTAYEYRCAVCADSDESGRSFRHRNGCPNSVGIHSLPVRRAGSAGGPWAWRLLTSAGDKRKDPQRSETPSRCAPFTISSSTEERSGSRLTTVCGCRATSSARAPRSSRWSGTHSCIRSRGSRDPMPPTSPGT